jgi:hypothetical protein
MILKTTKFGLTYYLFHIIHFIDCYISGLMDFFCSCSYQSFVSFNRTGRQPAFMRVKVESVKNCDNHLFSHSISGNNMTSGRKEL